MSATLFEDQSPPPQPPQEPEPGQKKMHSILGKVLKGHMPCFSVNNPPQKERSQSGNLF